MLCVCYDHNMDHRSHSCYAGVTNSKQKTWQTKEVWNSKQWSGDTAATLDQSFIIITIQSYKQNILGGPIMMDWSKCKEPYDRL